MPEGTHCRNPIIEPEKTSIEELVDRTMGKGMYSEDSHNKFELPIDTSNEVEVFWVRCKEGHFGPDYPFGPKGQNWIAKLSRNKLAMRWYDNTILLLKRVQILSEPRKKRLQREGQ